MRDVWIDTSFVILAMVALWCGGSLLSDVVVSAFADFGSSFKASNHSIFGNVRSIEEPVPFDWVSFGKLMVFIIGSLTTLFHLMIGRWREIGFYLGYGLMNLIFWMLQKREDHGSVEIRRDETPDFAFVVALMVFSFLVGSANPFFSN